MYSKDQTMSLLEQLRPVLQNQLHLLPNVPVQLQPGIYPPIDLVISCTKRVTMSQSDWAQRKAFILLTIHFHNNPIRMHFTIPYIPITSPDSTTLRHSRDNLWWSTNFSNGTFWGCKKPEHWRLLMNPCCWSSEAAAQLTELLGDWRSIISVAGQHCTSSTRLSRFNQLQPLQRPPFHQRVHILPSIKITPMLLPILPALSTK